MTVILHCCANDNGRGLYFKDKDRKIIDLCKEHGLRAFTDLRYPNELYVPYKSIERFILCATANNNLTIIQK